VNSYPGKVSYPPFLARSRMMRPRSFPGPTALEAAAQTRVAIEGHNNKEIRAYDDRKATPNSRPG